LDAADVRGLLGLLLPDGSLVPYRSPAGGYIQLTLTAGVSESAFLEDKVAEFRQFISTSAEIIPYKTRPRANGKTTEVLRFRVSTNKLRPVYNLLYPGGERQITQNALDLLGAKAAAWCWAEGARLNRDGSSCLARVGNSVDEGHMVSSWIEVLTGARSEIEGELIKPRLRFDAEQTRKIRESLASYAPPSRQHLFTGEQWDVHSIRSARTELQHRQGENRSQGEPQEALAGTQATRD
jgi:hypothetical protein